MLLRGARDGGEGTIIIFISSFNSVAAMPALDYYSASKFASKGQTQALTAKVAPLGIKVLAVEPGGSRTGIVERNQQSPGIEAYATTAHAIVELLENDRNGALAPSDPDHVAAVLIELVASGDMPQRLIVGGDAWGGVTAKLDAAARGV